MKFRIFTHEKSCRVLSFSSDMSLYRRNVNLFDFFVLFLLIPTEEAYRYRAITNFEGIENFYETVKIHRHRVPSSSESDDRKQLCKEMLKHPYFETRNVRWLDPDDEGVRSEILKNESLVLYRKWKRPRKYCPTWCYDSSPNERYEKLKRERFSMWQQFYDEKPEEFKKCIAWCRYKSTEYTYVNAPVDRSVVIGGEGNHSESVFLCPILLTNSNKIDSYYISDCDYDINEATSSEEITEFIPGRFIFAPADTTSEDTSPSRGTTSSKTISIVALVEDTARISVSQIEEFYLNRDLNQTPAKRKEDDPVCTLENKDKLRLCSSILNSKSLFRQVEFSSDEDSVIYDCAEQQISFRSENVVKDNLLSQWMVGCRARSVDGSSKLFYVSRGYNVNSAYLYDSPDEDVVFLYQYYINVSVLSA